MTTEARRTSPLHAEHRALGARMVEFGGWDMPIQYTSVLEEHRACRSDAAVFDVSHLGSVLVQGLVLGATQIAISLTGNALIAASAGQVARFLARRPRWLLIQRWMMGSVLGVLAMRMALEARR